MWHADRPIARWLQCAVALAALAVVALAALICLITRAPALTPASAQLYVARNATFASVGNLIDERYNPTATLLASGDVLVAGGLDLTGAAVAQAELYDPSTATFAPVAAMI